MGQLGRADRVARGKDARVVTPLESHAEFQPDGSRDPVGLLLEQSWVRSGCRSGTGGCWCPRDVAGAGCGGAGGQVRSRPRLGVAQG